MNTDGFGFTSDGNSGGTIGGGGTLNYISKFTGATTIGNSQMFDNGVSVGVGTITPDVTAKLDIVSTTQGFLAPRMTTAQRNLIVAPATGLLIYNTTTSFFNYFDGVTWIQIDSSTGGDVSGSGTTNFATMWTDGANSVIGDAPIKFGDTVTKVAPVNTGTDSIAIGYDITMSGTNNYLTGYSLVDDGGNNIFAQGRNLAITGGSFITDIVVLGFVNTFTVTSFTAGIYVLGDSNTFTDFATFSSIIGESNDFTRIDHSSSIGIFNILTDATYTYNFGESNTITTSTSIANFGVGNIIDTSSSFVNVGNSNVVTGATSSVIIGISNTNIGGFTNNYIIGNGITASATDRIEIGLDDTTKWVYDITGSASYGSTTARLSPNGSVSASGDIYTFDGTGDAWASPASVVGAVGWLLDGNTVGSLKYIGTNDTFDFPIYTDGVERARFLATNGNLGIGDVAPAEKLTVNGNVAPSVDASYSLGTLALRWTDLFLDSNIDYVTDLNFISGATTNVKFEATGNVGIGTTAPTARLHATGSTSDNTAYGLKVDSSGGTIWFDVRNDGAVNVGLLNGSGFDATFSVIQRNVAFTTIMDVYSVGATKLYFSASDNGLTGHATLGNSFLDIDNYAGTIRMGGISAGGTVRLDIFPIATGDVLSVRTFGGSGGFFVANNVTGDALCYLQDATGITTNVLFTSNGTSFVNGGDLGIGLSSGITSRLHVRGVDATVANYAVKAQDNVGVDLFNVRNDGSVGVGVLSSTGKLHTFGMLSGINQRLEPVSGVTEDVSGATVNTTDATVTTIQTIAIPTDKVVMIEARITARKTAGIGVGAVGDGNGYIRTACYANIAGVVTLSGAVQTSFTGEDIVAFVATLTISGTNVLVRITGAVDDNVTWNVITRTYQV